jgi:hypothetical protein
MHDPSTVIRDFKIGNTYIFTLWHIDPESDRTDDSCGWFAPKFTDEDRSIIEDMVDWDKGFPYFSTPNLPLTIVDTAYGNKQMLAGDCLAHVASAWADIAWRRDRRRKLTADEWWRVAFLGTDRNNNLRSALSDTELDPGERVARFLYCVMRVYLSHHRPWYRHPRWHIRCWRLQVHPAQALKRWLWTRCEHCGKRFPWGYAPTSVNWGGSALGWLKGGKGWFKGEAGVYHHECYPEFRKAATSAHGDEKETP